MLAVPTYDPDAPPPKNVADWRTAVWYRLGSIEREAKRTNGRVTRLEHIAAGAGLVLLGIAIGLGLLNLGVLFNLL